MSWSVVRALGAMALVGLLGCAGTDPVRVDPTPGGAARAELIGNDQTGVVGAELPDPIVVRVLDAAGNTVSGQIVNFVVTGGGGHVLVGVAITDVEGIARDWWTLDPDAGENTLEARAVDSDTGIPIVFGVFRALGVPPRE